LRRLRLPHRAPDIETAFEIFNNTDYALTGGGPDYLIQCCEPRSVTENTLRRGLAPSEDVVEMLG
jgi:hypothetical protein